MSAGADPTAIVQKAIVYHLIRNPPVLDRLRAELDAASLLFPASYEEVRNSSKLPYLEAVIKEGLRIHPTVGVCLERIGTQLLHSLQSFSYHFRSPERYTLLVKRQKSIATNNPSPLHPLLILNAPRKEEISTLKFYVVPEPGLTLPDGRFIPAGKIVGVNPSVVTRDRTVFGPDSDNFRPERWLRRYGEDTAVHTERLRKMDELATFVWGGGNRSCLGRFLATVSLYKVTSMLFSRYDVSLVDPTKEWVLRRHMMVYIDRIEVTITRRDFVPVKEEIGIS